MSPLLVLAALHQAPLSAAETARAYVAALSRLDLRAAAPYVDGGVLSEPARRLTDLVRQAAPKTLFFTLLDLKVDAGPQAATATIRLKGPAAQEETETFRLVLKEARWKVVPDAPDLATPKLVGGLTFGFVQPTVFLAILAPIEAQKAKAEARTADLQAMKALAIALLMWSADHDDLLPATTIDPALALKGYVKDKALFERFRLKDGVRWRMNPALAGKSLTSLDAPERTVMLYEEIGGKPAPREDGRQLVFLADGSVRFAAPEFAKTLLWTLPKPTPRKMVRKKPKG